MNLPPIEPRPPVPPRIYKRLYGLLDKELPKKSLAGRPKTTPRSKAALSSPAPRGTPSRGVPTKDLSLAQFRTPGKLGTPSRPKVSALPPWIRPTVRHICTALTAKDGPDLAPTVEAGLGVIVSPYGQLTEDEWVNTHLTTLVGAIYWYVSKSAALAPGEEMTDENFQDGYKGARKDILGALRSARVDVQTPNPTSRGKKAEITDEQEAGFWEGWQHTIKVADFDETITEITNRGWLNSDWYRSIEFLRDAAEGAGEELDDLDADPTSAANVQTTRPDTMLQDKFDYLSERKRAEYRRWETNILRRIELLEAGQQGDAMALDA